MDTIQSLMEYLFFAWGLILLHWSQVTYANCPPPFPNFDAIFSRTLRFGRPEKVAILEQVRLQLASAPNCKYNPNMMSEFAIDRLNQERCTRSAPYFVEFYCLTTTVKTTLPTTPLRTKTSGTSSSTQSTSPFIERPGSTNSISSSSSSSTDSITTPRTYSTSISSAFDIPSSTDETGLPIEPSLEPGPPGAVSDQTGSSFVIWISVVGALICVIAIIVAVYMLRSQCVITGSQRRKRGKSASKKNDSLRSLASSRRSDMYDSQPPTPTPSTVMENGTMHFKRAPLSTGRQLWLSRQSGRSIDSRGSGTADNYQAPDALQVSCNGKYILLREDSDSSALMFDMHYQTLSAIDHPHALNMGGFGESSTDQTLPRTLHRKRVQGGDLPPITKLQEENEAETKFISEPLKSSVYQKKEKTKLDSNRNEVPLDRLISIDSGQGSSNPSSNGSDSPPMSNAADSLTEMDMALGENFKNPLYRDSCVKEGLDGIDNPAFDNEDTRNVPIDDVQVHIINEKPTNQLESRDSLDAVDNDHDKPNSSLNKPVVIEPPVEFKDETLKNRPGVKNLVGTFERSHKPERLDFSNGHIPNGNVNKGPVSSHRPASPRRRRPSSKSPTIPISSPDFPSQRPVSPSRFSPKSSPIRSEPPNFSPSSPDQKGTNSTLYKLNPVKKPADFPEILDKTAL